MSDEHSDTDIPPVPPVQAPVSAPFPFPSSPDPDPSSSLLNGALERIEALEAKVTAAVGMQEVVDFLHHHFPGQAPGVPSSLLGSQHPNAETEV